MDVVLQLLLAVIAGGGVVKGLDYLGKRREEANERREHAGSVATSDAALVFAEGTQIRKELREMNAEYVAEIADLHRTVARQGETIDALQAKVDAQQSTIDALQKQDQLNRAVIDELRTKTALSTTEAAVLRRKVEEQQADLALVHREMNIVREKP